MTCSVCCTAGHAQCASVQPRPAHQYMFDTIQSMSDSLLDSNSRIARGLLTKPSSMAWYITSNVTRALMSLQLHQIADECTSCTVAVRCDAQDCVCVCVLLRRG